MYCAFDVGSLPSLEVDPATWSSLGDSPLVARQDLVTLAQRFSLVRIDDDSAISAFSRSALASRKPLYANTREFSFLGRVQPAEAASFLPVYFRVAVSAEAAAGLCVAARRFPHVASWVFGNGIALPYGDMVDLVVAVAGARAVAGADSAGSFSFDASDVSEPSEGNGTHAVRLLEVARARPGLRVTISSMHRGVARDLLRHASTTARPVLIERVNVCLETRAVISDATVSIGGDVFQADKLASPTGRAPLGGAY